jgi:putative endonuclease
MNFWERIRFWRGDATGPKHLHLRHGRLGESTARKHLQRLGLKHLTSNFRSARGEIDLVFRQEDCLVFVEVKTRSSEDWVRPAAAVNARKRLLLSQAALDYLRLLKNPPIKVRFDVVEVLLDNGAVRHVRHLPNTFGLSKPYRFG